MVILDLKRILTEIERIIPSACHSVEVLVLGDFNFRKACWDTGSSTLSDKQSLIDFLCVETSLVQIIDSPTHKSGNILDLAFFSHEHKWSYTVLERDMSDHSPVILITDVVMTLENHETQFSFAQFNYSLFKEVFVMNRALAESCHSQNPCFLFQWFQLLDNAMQLSLPRKRQKRLQLPFFYSSQTVHQINKLRSAERRSAPTPVLQKLSSDLATLIEMDKTVLLRNLTTYTTHDAFALLRKLNNNASYPSTMTYGSLSANNALAKADLFNRFFCSVYIETNEETVLPQADNPSIFLSDLCFSVEIVQKYLENVPRSNKPAADGIPPVLLNTMSEHLAPFVYLLFTYITSTLSWPDIWKCAFVTPVHKKGSRSDIQNYRPISILPRLSLIFEKLLFDLIYRKVRNKINYSQHGFQRGKSTGTQLIEFLDELYQNFDINEEQIVVYLDIRKAFDSVSHATLLDKLKIRFR